MRRETYTWVHQTFPRLLPLPALDTCAVVAGVVAHDACMRHYFLFWLQPSHFRGGAEEEQAGDTGADCQPSEELR